MINNTEGFDFDSQLERYFGKSQKSEKSLSEEKRYNIARRVLDQIKVSSDVLSPMFTEYVDTVFNYYGVDIAGEIEYSQQCKKRDTKDTNKNNKTDKRKIVPTRLASRIINGIVAQLSRTIPEFIVQSKDSSVDKAGSTLGRFFDTVFSQSNVVEDLPEYVANYYLSGEVVVKRNFDTKKKKLKLELLDKFQVLTSDDFKSSIHDCAWVATRKVIDKNHVLMQYPELEGILRKSKNMSDEEEIDLEQVSASDFYYCDSGSLEDLRSQYFLNPSVLTEKIFSRKLDPRLSNEDFYKSEGATLSSSYFEMDNSDVVEVIEYWNKVNKEHLIMVGSNILFYEEFNRSMYPIHVSKILSSPLLHRGVSPSSNALPIIKTLDILNTRMIIASIINSSSVNVVREDISNYMMLDDSVSITIPIKRETGKNITGMSEKVDLRIDTNLLRTEIDKKESEAYAAYGSSPYVDQQSFNANESSRATTLKVSMTNGQFEYAISRLYMTMFTDVAYGILDDLIHDNETAGVLDVVTSNSETLLIVPAKFVNARGPHSKPYCEIVVKNKKYKIFKEDEYGNILEEVFGNESPSSSIFDFTGEPQDIQEEGFDLKENERMYKDFVQEVIEKSKGKITGVMFTSDAKDLNIEIRTVPGTTLNKIIRADRLTSLMQFTAANKLPSNDLFRKVLELEGLNPDLIPEPQQSEQQPQQPQEAQPQPQQAQQQAQVMNPADMQGNDSSAQSNSANDGMNDYNTALELSSTPGPNPMGSLL